MAILLSIDEFNASEKLKEDYETEQIRLGQAEIKVGRYIEGLDFFKEIINEIENQ